ncbi:MAG TPA: helicase-related protein, partial [Gemmatimonadales bacterium]|nr:helicase-related protein [Gemmatimonadales bacterium]
MSHLDSARLASADQVAHPALLQIQLRDPEPVRRRGKGREPGWRLRVGQENAVALPGAAPDPTPELVQLREPEAIRVLEFVRTECAGGRQAYVVLPVIEESERADLRAATGMAEALAARWHDLRVGLVHGRLKPEERDGVMRRFRAGEIHVLVATTVIEVGIDVPNATVMVIEHPDRFGLAQLHQLRGRIGRGAGESYCILLADAEPPP